MEDKIRKAYNYFTENSNSTYIALSIFVVLISVFFYTLTSNDLLVGFTSDDAIYLLLADLYSFQTTGKQSLYELIRQVSYFPPVYPMIMGLLGGGSADPALAGVITVTFLLISIFISGIWVWKETANAPISIATVLLMFLLPGTLILSQELWSEFLFMVFIYGTFLVGCNPKLESKNWLGMAILIALASYTRSIGIALVIAFCLLLIKNRVKFGAAYAVISLVPFLYWNVAREHFMDRSDYIDTFSSSIFDVSLNSITDLISEKIILLFDSVLWLFASVQTSSAHSYFSIIILLVVLVFIIIGFFIRIRLLKLDAIFVILYMSIIFVWPYNTIYFVSRFLFPLLPLFLFYFYLGTLEIIKSKNFLNPSLAALYISLLIISYPSTTQYIKRAYLEVEPELKPYRRNQQWLISASDEDAILFAQSTKFIIDGLKLISHSIPENECVNALQAPMVMLHTKRIAGVLPSPEVSNIEFYQETSLCKYFLSMPLYDSESKFPTYYPIRRLNNENFKVSAYYGDGENVNGPELFLLERIVD